MKRLVTFSLALLSSGSLSYGQKPKDVPALIMVGENATKGLIVSASKRAIRFKEKKNSINTHEKRLANLNIYFYQPSEFTEAMLLFKSRNYEAARPLFAACAKTYKKVDEIKGNYSTLAKFYEMECARKMNDLAGLGTLMESFIAGPLLNKDHIMQIEINGVFWEAVENKSWKRLLSVALDPKWVEKKLPGAQRAQIAFCTGLSFEGTEQPVKALTAYNHAFTADFGASEDVTRKAALNCLRILKTHEATKLAISLWGTEDFNDRLEGAAYLNEGKALISLWDKSLGGGERLPGEYAMFKKYGAAK